MYSQVKQNLPVSDMITIVIGTSVTTSAAYDLADYDLVGLITPSTFDGTDITFLGSADNSTFVPVAASNGAATAYTIVTTTSTGSPINPTIFAGFRYIKIKTTTNQATTDTIFTILKRKRT